MPEHQSAVFLWQARCIDISRLNAQTIFPRLRKEERMTFSLSPVIHPDLYQHALVYPF